MRPTCKPQPRRAPASISSTSSSPRNFTCRTWQAMSSPHQIKTEPGTSICALQPTPTELRRFQAKKRRKEDVAECGQIAEKRDGRFIHCTYYSSRNSQTNICSILGIIKTHSLSISVYRKSVMLSLLQTKYHHKPHGVLGW